VVSDVTAGVQLAAVQGVVRLKKADPAVTQLLKDIQEFRQAYSVPTEAPPYVLENTDTVEVHLTEEGPLKDALQLYFQRDWPGIVAATKTEARADLAALTARLQSNFKQAVGRSSFPKEVIRSAYVVAATLPPLAAFTYIVGYGIPLTDVRTILSVGGASLAARFFAYLDERSLSAEWNRGIQKWYSTEHSPRLRQILHTRLALSNQFRSSSDHSDLEHLQAAVNALGHIPPQLSLQAGP
jgi:hypothetical protein